MARAADPRWPTAVADVVYQTKQFSWTIDHRTCGWNGSVGQTVYDALHLPNPGYTHYHADYVSPWWSKHYQRAEQIGAHIFYH